MSEPRRSILGYIADRPHVTVILIICISLIGFTTAVRFYAEEAKRQAAYDTAKTFQASITALHQYYSSEIEPRARAAGVEFDMDYQASPSKLPFPATVSMEFGDTLQTVNPILNTNLYSMTPFRVREGRELDDFEMKSLAYLEKNPDSEYYRIENIDGQEAVRYAAAVIMKQDCADCHNRPEFGFDGKWEAGDFRGARQVSMPIPDMTPIIDKATYTAVLLAIISSCLGGLVVWPIVGRLHRSLKTSKALTIELETKNHALEEASQVKNQFLAGISHDLRSPLNGILGFSYLLNDENKKLNLDETARQYAANIQEGANNLRALIDELLDISSIESGNWELVEEQIATGPFLEKLSPLLQNLLQKSGLDLVLDTSVELPNLRADSRAIIRILNNLVENAGKYSKGTKVEVMFSLEDDQSLVLRVSDDGKGMQFDDLGTATDFGSRANREERSVSSYGIGLWSVETLAALHDATVKIDTCENMGGCRVSVKFPKDRTIKA